MPCSTSYLYWNALQLQSSKHKHYKKLVYFSGPKFVGKGSEFVGNVTLPRTFPRNTFMGKRAAIVRTFPRNVVGNACQRVSAQLRGNRRGKCVSGEAGLAGHIF
ncbi:hypothetical protein QL285_085881 [Trifolium repens]|nr:hypothetical protein QL285_085881 [Trifolium repens]